MPATAALRCACELAALIEACDETIPFEVCEALAPLVVQLRNLEEAIARFAQKDETARRLMTIPGLRTPRLIADHRDGMASERASGHLVDQSRRGHSVTDDDQRLAHGISWLGT